MNVLQRSTRAIVVGLVVATMIAACGSGDSDPRSTVAAEPGDTPWHAGDDPTAAAGASEDARLLAKYGPAPLDAFQWTAEEQDTIDRATTHRIVTCMEKLGFTYPPPPEEDSSRVVTHWGDALGLIDPDQASTRGYASDLAAGLVTPQAGPPEQASDPSWLDALNKKDGCYDQTSAADPMSPDINYELPADLYNQALATASADATFRAAKDEWKKCMAAAGYQLDDFPMAFSNDPPAKQPLDQAVTDVECKQSSGTVDTFITALYAAEAALADAHADELHAYQAAQEERVRRATADLGG